MCKERIKEIEQKIERLEEQIEQQDAQTKDIEGFLEVAKRQASTPKKTLRARRVRTRDNSVESLRGQLTSSQRKSSSLKSERMLLKKSLKN